MKSIIKKLSFWAIFLGALLQLGLGFSATGLQARQNHTKVDLIAEQESIQPGIAFWVGLHMKMEPGWKTYWENPGEAGLPTAIEWQLPEGFTVSSLQWPTPEVTELDDIIGYGYKDEVLLLAKITPSKNITGEAIIKGRVTWLECNELCIPGSAEVTLTLPVSINEPGINSVNRDLFTQTQARLPKHSAVWSAEAYLDEKELLIWVQPKSGVEVPVPNPKSVYFYSLDRGVTALDEDQHVEAYGKGLLIKASLNPNNTEPIENIAGVLYSTEGWDAGGTPNAIEIRSKVHSEVLPPAEASGSFFSRSKSIWTIGAALVSAFIGGLILNLMPCVFPVLGLKILSFVSYAKENKWVLRMHGFVFAAGVIISFWCLSCILLGLRTMGQQLGWGFQLQTPGFIAFLVILLFVMGLNFAGVFEIGQSVMGVGSKFAQKQGYGGSFFSGVLATLVATPCTAPFMGAALGYALSQPPHIALLIFTFLGLGMSTPYLVLTFIPALIRWLPRPGAWMETFKVIMAFPLWATVIWLLWVFALQTGPNAQVLLLFALLVIGFGCWAFGRWSVAHKSKRSKVWGYAVTSICAFLGLVLALRAQTDVGNEANGAYGNNPGIVGSINKQNLLWLSYSDDLIQELRAKGQPIYIDFTAAWCLTCQANKKIVFSSESVVDTFKEHNFAMVRADWTKHDPRITAALEKFGRSGVPLNVIYPADPNAEPIILPATLTPGKVLEVLQETSVKNKQ